jgi:hypothetical protein
MRYALAQKLEKMISKLEDKERRAAEEMEPTARQYLLKHEVRYPCC